MYFENISVVNMMNILFVDTLTKIIGKFEEKDRTFSHFEKIGENFLSFSHDFLTIFVSVVI